MAITYQTSKNLIRGLNDFINYQFATYNISFRFPKNIAKLTRNELYVAPCVKRKDFRGEKALTIDSADCKDMDDAISLIRIPNGYRLAVHIADVATYVPLGSELDEIATHRATSIYLPNFTVPMLPKVLSNDCCSLNPRVDRYTLSVIMKLNHNGKVISSEITKGQIRSRVKGIYSEINSIISGKNDESLKEKYAEVYEELFDMVRLYELLRKERDERGANISDSNRPKISISEHNIKLIPTVDGIAENMIEEFMILANRVVAEYLYYNELPAIFRIQEEKNHLAAYKSEKSHHADLALESYSHFTSPIRRIADLKIHQILTMYLDGVDNKTIHQLFDESLIDICDIATKRSRTVKSVQDRCERYCYEEFFKMNRNTTYTGTFVGVDKKQRPIIMVDDYNIKIIGYTLINGIVGHQYSFKVGFSSLTDELVASQIKMAS